MSRNVKEYATWFPVRANTFSPYLVDHISPPLDVGQLNARLLAGEERKVLRTPFTGVYTVVLSYKDVEGCVMSFDEVQEDMVVLQVQGARSRKSYRVTTGMQWVDFFADQAKEIALHPESPFMRLVLPVAYAIPGLINVLGERENVLDKYITFAAVAGLRLSQQEQAYIRDVRK